MNTTAITVLSSGDAGYARFEDVINGVVAEKPDDRKGASLGEITTNLITAGLGAGILSLPWAMAGASLLPSVATTLLVMCLNAITVMLLVTAAERTQAFDLGSLLGHLPGRVGSFAQYFCNTLIVASVFLCLVGYIVVVADSLEPFMRQAFGFEDADWWVVRAPLLAAGGIMVMPLCFLDQRRLSAFSLLGILVNIYLFALVLSLLKGSGPSPEICVLSHVNEGTIAMFSTLMQCSIIQMCVLPMYEELEDRSPRRFGIAVGVAFSFLALLLTTFAGAAYFLFGPGVHPNVIQDFPHDFAGGAARIGMAVVVVAVYPLILSSMTAPIRHWEDAAGSDVFKHTSTVVTVAIVFLSSVGAAFVGQLGTLNELNGAMQVGCLIGVAPGLAGFYLLGRSGVWWRLCMAALVVASLAMSALGLYFTGSKPERIAESCIWMF